MDINVFPDSELETVFRALRTALRPAGDLTATEHAFLRTYARITGRTVDPATVMPVVPSEVTIAHARGRKRLVQLCAMAALLGHPVNPGSVAFVEAMARHLRIAEPVLQVLDALRAADFRRARRLAVRRAFGGIVRDAYHGEGLLGVLRFFAALRLGLAVNRGQHWDFKRLGLLPDGTLGREYWKHMTRVGFGFPGEPGGIPKSVAYHDIGHVLAQHETTPLGEIQQACFQAGSRRDDGFLFVQFVILQFHHGIKLTPATDAHEGHFDPELALWALHRGASCAVDVTRDWDYWPLMPLSVEEAASRIGLLPKLSPAPGDTAPNGAMP